MAAPEVGIDKASRDDSIFPFLLLPAEIRLQIYAHLLPPRTHQIATQFPYSGCYYAPTPATVLRSLFPRTQFLVPASPSSTHPPKLTTYILLNANYRTDFPHPSIDPAILRVSKAVHAEAEPVLYGNRETRWDFGVYVEAVAPFWGDRSRAARNFVRGLRVAREIPALEVSGREAGGDCVRDDGWEALCLYLRKDFAALRTVELTVWGEGGATRELPLELGSAVVVGGGKREEERVGREEQSKWREWEWTRNLLAKEGLRQVRVRWWAFESAESNMQGKFDGWLGRRMIADDRVKEGILAAGYVSEGVVILDAQ